MKNRELRARARVTRGSWPDPNRLEHGNDSPRGTHSTENIARIKAAQKAVDGQNVRVVHFEFAVAEVHDVAFGFFGASDDSRPLP